MISPGADAKDVDSGNLSHSDVAETHVIDGKIVDINRLHMKNTKRYLSGTGELEKSGNSTVRCRLRASVYVCLYPHLVDTIYC